MDCRCLPCTLAPRGSVLHTDLGEAQAHRSHPRSVIATIYQSLLDSLPSCLIDALPEPLSARVFQVSERCTGALGSTCLRVRRCSGALGSTCLHVRSFLRCSREHLSERPMYSQVLSEAPVCASGLLLGALGAPVCAELPLGCSREHLSAQSCLSLGASGHPAWMAPWPSIHAGCPPCERSGPSDHKI